MNDPVQDLVRLRTRLLEMADQLSLVSDLPDQITGQLVTSGEQVKRRRLGIAISWQRSSAIRFAHFKDGDSLFSDPAWEILLDLYIAAARERPTSVTDGCLAAKVPTTTGLRWLQRLENAGLISRHQDPNDKRRVYISLTESGRERTEQTLDAAIESDRRLGLARLQILQ